MNENFSKNHIQKLDNNLTKAIKIISDSRYLRTAIGRKNVSGRDEKCGCSTGFR